MSGEARGGQRGMGSWVRGWVLVVVLLTGAGVFSLLLPPAQVAHASTLSVTTCADSGTGSLRNVITNATAGDTITFATDCPTSNTIRLTGGTLTLSRDVTIDGTGRQVVVDGGCITDANSDCTGGGSTVFFIGRANVTLRALTIQYGNGFQGGGIYNNNANGTLTVTGSTFAHNSASYYGGGIFNAGPLTVINSTFANNSAPTTGGGIFNYLGTLNGDRQHLRPQLRRPWRRHLHQP